MELSSLKLKKLIFSQKKTSYISGGNFPTSGKISYISRNGTL